MAAPRRPGSHYLPGRLYDLAFSRMFGGVRDWVARAVDGGRFYPWLDVCCGTGDQLRGRAGGPAFGLDLSYGFIRYAAARAPDVPFVRGDAARLPFRDGSLRAVSISVGLHDKGRDLRAAILAEARRVLAPGGRLVAVDFEGPWNAASRAGALFARTVERLAGREHYRNGRDFLRRGGLRAALAGNGFTEVARRDIAFGSLGAVVARVSDAAGACDPAACE
jgi:demethylmenaquinone methyltransferase/2-methoxy-6-polyprenyl-1,4-benzoquinol methylase